MRNKYTEENLETPEKTTILLNPTPYSVNNFTTESSN